MINWHCRHGFHCVIVGVTGTQVVPLNWHVNDKHNNVVTIKLQIKMVETAAHDHLESFFRRAPPSLLGTFCFHPHPRNMYSSQLSTTLFLTSPSYSSQVQGNSSTWLKWGRYKVNRNQRKNTKPFRNSFSIRSKSIEDVVFSTSNVLNSTPPIQVLFVHHQSLGNISIYLSLASTYSSSTPHYTN